MFIVDEMGNVVGVYTNIGGNAMLTVSGAYGRDYKSKKAILVDWNAGKDFVNRNVFCGGAYINKEDAEKAGMSVINVRYRSDRSVATIKRGGNGQWE